MPLISTASIPAGCRAQSEDTSAEIDWLMFERLRSWSLVDRVQRYCTFTRSMRALGSRLTCAESASRRFGAEWLNYCLNLEHDDGKQKARLFSSILGMTAGNAEELRQILLEVVKTHEARLGRQDEFGQRYTLDFTIEWQNRNATLRSGWIIEHSAEIPKLTTCYPL